jgi:hypothetical protein
VEKAKSSSIAYYVSAHGYGHGVRSCNIIQAINRLYPHVTVYVVSALPTEFLSGQIDLNRNILRSKSFDVGMVQIDSIRVDIPCTLKEISRLYARRKGIVTEEVSFLREQKIRTVVVDIPGLPIEAAAKVGIPRLAVGNFAWDWIYSEFAAEDAAWQPIVNLLRGEYSQTDLLLRLPLSEKMAAFPRILDIPLVASPGKQRREEIRALTRCNSEKKWILLSFTTLEWSEEALTKVESICEYEFFTVHPLAWQRKNIYALRREQMPFADILASMDAVISKPGFGILSDCIANKKPLIYADRSNFREYPILVDAIQKYMQHVHIPTADLYGGNLTEYLSRIWQSPDPTERPDFGGDRIAAQQIAQYAV